MRNLDKVRFARNSSVGVVIVSVVLFAASFIYIGVNDIFPGWEALAVVIGGQIALGAWYLWMVHKTDIYDPQSYYAQNRLLLWSIVLQLLVINPFAFCSGIYFYSLLHRKLNHLL